MREPEIIDAEFEVIDPGTRGETPTRSDELPADGSWSFWEDDFPALGSVAVIIVLAYLAKVFLF